MDTMRKAMIPKILALLAATLLTGGCLGKGGGGGAVVPAAAPTMSTGALVAGSVTAARAADGAVTVRWRSAEPTAGGYVLAATLHFQDRPIYGIVIPESADAPTTDHAAAITGLPAGEPVRIAVTDGVTGLDDNGGLGYLAE